MFHQIEDAYLPHHQGLLLSFKEIVVLFSIYSNYLLIIFPFPYMPLNPSATIHYTVCCYTYHILLRNFNIMEYFSGPIRELLMGPTASQKNA